MFQSAVFLRRGVSSGVTLKFGLLNRSPYLLVLADLPDICKLCLEQFDASNEDDCHRVSIYFCSKYRAPSLRGLMESCIAQGAPCARLSEEVRVLNLGRIAEEYIEGPHRPFSQFKGLVSPGNGGWVCRAGCKLGSACVCVRFSE